jgi:hypothetical protein
MVDVDAPRNSVVQDRYGILVCAISIVFLSGNLLLSFFVLHDSFPMSVYLGTTTFLICYYTIKKAVPRSSRLSAFFLAYLACLIPVWLLLTWINGLTADPWMILEPFLFLPVPGLFVFLKGMTDRKTLVMVAFLLAGITLLAIASTSIIPNSPVTSSITASTGGKVNLYDSKVPAGLFTAIYIWFQVPLMFFVGVACVCIWWVARKRGIFSESIFVPALVVAAFLSLYVIGIAIAWFLIDARLNRNRS